MEKLKEIFLIKDYGDGTIGYYLTNNAKGCYDALADIDALNDRGQYDSDDDYFENMSDEIVKELGRETIIELENIKYSDHWLNAFLKLCELRNIAIEEADSHWVYYY